MSKLKKLTKQQLFLPIFCMLLVLCVNIVYDVAQGRDFYDFFKIYIQNDMLNGRIVNILNRGSEVAILAIGMTPGGVCLRRYRHLGGLRDGPERRACAVPCWPARRRPRPLSWLLSP